MSNRVAPQARPLKMVTAILFYLVANAWTSPALGQGCGDADGSGQVTVTDGVKVLRQAAGLSADCPASSCDVDGNGVISVTDGVNVLRAAAGLVTTLSCVTDPFISEVTGQDGVFGKLVKVPGGLTAPPGAPRTIENVAVGSGFAEGRLNTITIDYDNGVQAQADGGTGSLFVASVENGAASGEGFFDLPLATSRGQVTVTLHVKPNVAVQKFTLELTTGASGNVIGQVTPVVIFVLQNSNPACGNRVLDQDETCDPPGFGCPVIDGDGFCNQQCVCEKLVRFVDNGDGTVTDEQTALQWEKKSGVVTSLRDCTLAPCSDPHDVNNTYQWCADIDHANFCDTAGNPPDGDLFTSFLATLNAPPCFAGHCDWRLPTINRFGQKAELETIVNLGVSGCGNTTTPCIDPIFGPASPNTYWSGTTGPMSPGDALGISFFDGGLIDDYKADDKYVRAVRGGQ